MAIRVLTQVLGLWDCPVAYLAEQLNVVAQGWPPCPKAFVATAIEDTLAVKSKNDSYQGFLCENLCITLETVNTLNPAIPLPIEPGAPLHDCIETVDEIFSSWKDLMDCPLEEPDVEYFTDGSSFITRDPTNWVYSGNPRLSNGSPICANSPESRSNSLGKSTITGKRQKSQHIRGLLTTQGTNIRYLEEILQLLDAVWAPEEIAVMHCKSHQKAVTPEAKGNRKAEREAKKAACAMTLFPEALCSEASNYSPNEKAWFTQETGNCTKEG
ncbi:Gag-Pol polyprotein [Plecturocebus cupreus]